MTGKRLETITLAALGLVSRHNKKASSCVSGERVRSWPELLTQSPGRRT